MILFENVFVRTYIIILHNNKQFKLFKVTVVCVSPIVLKLGELIEHFMNNKNVIYGCLNKCKTGFLF